MQGIVNHPVDSLNKSASSVADQARQKIDDGNEQVADESLKVNQEVTDAVSKATDGNVKIPDRDLKKSPAVNTILEANIPDQQLPGIGQGKSNLPEVEIPSSTLPGHKINVDQLKEKANDVIPQTDKITEVTGEVRNLDKMAEVGKYEAELGKIKNTEVPTTDKVANEAEQRVANLDQIKAVSEETEKITKLQAEQEALLQRYRDKKLLQQEIERKAKSVVNDKLNQFSPAFREVQEKVAKAKKANPTVQSIKEIAKKRPNPMRDTPVRERLVPGITLQAYTNEAFTVDWGAQLGYKFTGRLTVGTGYVYRTAVSEDYSTWIRGGSVYGYRAYAHFGLIRSFYLHGEYETVRLNDAALTTAVERDASSVHSGYFGIGRRYDISPKLRGSVIVLYRAEFDGDLPSMSRINLRMGIDLNMKNKRRGWNR
jgi:hypothetical protein